jgi:hypothetical protein
MLRSQSGNANYLKLITFKTIEDAEPIPGKVAAIIPLATMQRPPETPANLPTSAPPSTSASSPQASMPPVTRSEEAKPPANGKIIEPKAGEAVNTHTYYTLGNGRKWNLPREMLADIAVFAGVDVKAKQPDFAAAFALLPYFAEGKAGGVGLATLKEIMQQCKMDVHQAIPVMRGKVRS